MLRIGVMVSGGGTNLQAIMDAMDSGRITNTELAVVISNNANAYALERARLRGCLLYTSQSKNLSDFGITYGKWHEYARKELGEILEKNYSVLAAYDEVGNRNPVSYTHLDVYKRQMWNCMSHYSSWEGWQ